MCFSTKTPKRRGGTLLQISVCGGYGAPCPPPSPAPVPMVNFSSNYRTWYIMSNCTRSQYLGYVHTTYRKAFRADSECASGILWTVTAQNWNKSFTNINQTAPKWGTEPFRYVTLHGRDQQRGFAPLQKQRQKSVADPGEGPGGPGPPYFYTKLRPDGPKKIFLRLSPPPPYLRIWMTTPPPLISRSKSPFFHVNRGPILYGFSAAANANRYSVNVSLIKLPLHRIYTEIILPFFSSIFRLICCGL